jgi:hypothetical protein
MIRKSINDWRSPRIIYNLSEDISSNYLGEYYFKFEEKRVAAGKDQKLISKFDKDGIPINKTYIDVQDKEYVYFPISIGQMGLAVYHTYLQTKSDADKDRFLRFAEWFYRSATIDEKRGARWLTDVPLPQYRNPGPWQSAFAQSRAVSVLLRGYQISGDMKYANYAEQALRSFTLPVDQGGVTSYTGWGPFYEEYTAEVPTLVLNGMIFSLFGIMDYIRVFPENILARRLFDEGIQTLEGILPSFDLGYWSRYNLCKAEWYPETDPSTISYQRLHVVQLRMLYHLTDREIFETYAGKFSAQDNIINAIRMYTIKYQALKELNRV